MEDPLDAPRYRLGRYHEYPVPAALERVAEAAWHYMAPPTGSVPPGHVEGHRVLPDPAVSLAVAGRCEGGEWADLRVVVVGPVRDARFYRPAPGEVLCAVRLRPEWSARILGADPADHVDALPEWTPAWAGRLRDAVAREAPDDAVSVLRRLLHTVDERHAAAPGDGPAALASSALARLARPGGTTMALHRVARDLGVSERHLRRTVIRTTGASPKLHHRVRRLNAAVLAADASPHPHWSRLAHAFGFHDQAHLAREVRALTGLTPTFLHAERQAQRVTA